MEKYKGYFVPPHENPKEKTADDFCGCVNFIDCKGVYCSDCLFFVEYGKRLRVKGRPEFKEWLKRQEEKEA